MTDESTREREIASILAASSATGCDSLLILTNSEKATLTRGGKQIDVMPVWKWLLQSN
jgi:ATPase